MLKNDKLTNFKSWYKDIIEFLDGVYSDIFYFSY